MTAPADRPDATPPAPWPSGAPIPERSDYDPSFDPAAPIACDLCGGTMEYTRSCRIICRNCGYTRDCSDP